MNFFSEFSFWENLLEWAANFSDLKPMAEYFENMADNYPSCQKTLYDFPLYYVGK